MTLRLAHLSDLHFATTTFDWKDFASKQWVGYLNSLIFRRHKYNTDALWQLPDEFKDLNINWICITGDVTTTARDEEFAQAKFFIDELPSPVLILPGNHDLYTRRSEKERTFYRTFPEIDMENERVAVKPLSDNWWWVGIDCAYACPLTLSNGIFFDTMIAPLERILQELPPDARVVFANHFPLFESRGIKHDLQGREKLQKIIQRYPQIKLYLHGHDHTPYIIQKEGYPLVINSGSTSRKKGALYSLLDLYDKECILQQGHLTEQGVWALGEKRQYFFR